MNSPWQTLNSEKKNEFIFWDSHYLIEEKTRFGKCIRWIGITMKDISYERFSLLCNNLKNKNFIGIINAIPNYYNDIEEEYNLYEKNGFTVDYKWGTYLLDIDAPIDIIKKGMSNSLKRNIKKLEKYNYSLKDISFDESVMLDFKKIYYEARSRENIGLKDNFENCLSMTRYSKNRKYFVLYIDKIPVACQGICYNSDVAIENILAISNYAHDNRIYAGDLLKWKIIEWCKDKNIKIYDFAGVSPSPINAKEVGIKNYKAKWGGRYLEYNVYAKSLSIRFIIYKKIKYILKNILKHKK